MSQLCDRNGNVIEQIVFAELNFRDRIPRTPSSRRSTARLPLGAAGRAGAAHGQRAARLERDPPAVGFPHDDLAAADHRGSNVPVRHLVLSDGLASVSVFIEPRSPQTERCAGWPRSARRSRYSRDLDGHQVTAVGEVPAATVEAIAEAVDQGRGRRSRRSPATQRQ